MLHFTRRQGINHCILYLVYWSIWADDGRGTGYSSSSTIAFSTQESMCVTHNGASPLNSQKVTSKPYYCSFKVALFLWWHNDQHINMVSWRSVSSFAELQLSRLPVTGTAVSEWWDQSCDLLVYLSITIPSNWYSTSHSPFALNAAAHSWTKIAGAPPFNTLHCPLHLSD